jgi:aspartyl-tRNA(Asn)/glutamyl-tRNA(Gln) amidotransferase subunit C
MQVSVEDTARIARLAHLSFSQEELTVFSGELSHILTWISIIAQADIEGVEALVSPAPIQNPHRPVNAEPGLSADEALLNAPATEGMAFRLPRVL